MNPQDSAQPADNQPQPEPPAAAGFAGSPSASQPQPTTGLDSVPQSPAASAPLPGAAFGPAPAAAEPPAPALPKSPEPLPPNPLPMPGHKRHKKGLIIGLIAAALVLLLSAAAAASYYYLEVNKPENILKQALANSLDLSKAKTMEFSGSSVAKSDTEELSMNSTFKGVMDNASGAFDINGETDAYLTKLTYDIRSTDGKSFYFKIGGLDGLAELITGMSGSAETGTVIDAYAPLIEMVNDQWFEINESLLKQYIPGYKSGVIKEADVTKIVDAYLAHPFLVIKEVLPSDEIKGKDHYHYRLAVSAAEMKAFFKAVKDAKIEAFNLDQKMLDAINSSIKQSEFDKLPFEIWISKDDKMINQIAFNVSQDGVTASMKLTVDSYNKPVKVEKPEGSKSLLELLGGLFGGGAPTDLPLELMDELPDGGNGSVSL